MKNFFIRYEIWIFLILAPIINTLVVFIRTEDYIPENVYNHGRFVILLLLLVFIVKYTRGVVGIKDMFKPMTKWKVKPSLYLLSFAFAFIIGCITLMVKALMNGEDIFSLIVIQSDAMFPLLALILLIWAFCGEVVWVSYCVRELSKKTSVFIASQIVGVFWTLWWFPVVYLGEGVIPDFPYVALLFGMMATAGMCAVIYEMTKSGLAVWLLQFMLNSSLIILPVSPKVGGPETYTIYAAIYYIVMLGFMLYLYPKAKLLFTKTAEVN